MEYKVYLFDFDYTLVNSETGIVGCFQRVLKKFDYPEVSADTIKKTIGLPMEDALSEVTGETDPAVIQKLQTAFSHESDELMTKNTFFFPDTLPVLTKLKASGCKTGIISTKKRSRIREKLVADDVTSLIDLIIGREDVQLPKPDPEGLEKALAALQIRREEILYTGDSIIDAKAAQNAGIDFAAVTTGMTTPEDFSPYPCKKMMRTLAELL